MATKTRTPAVGDPVIWYGEKRQITSIEHREWNDRATAQIEDVDGTARRDAARAAIEEERARFEADYSNLTDTQKAESAEKIKALDETAREVFLRFGTPVENLQWVEVDGGAWTTNGRLLSDRQKEAFMQAMNVKKISTDLPAQLAALKYLTTIGLGG